MSERERERDRERQSSIFIHSFIHLEAMMEVQETIAMRLGFFEASTRDLRSRSERECGGCRNPNLLQLREWLKLI